MKIKREAIDKLASLLDSGFNSATTPFNNKEYAAIYHVCYHMCTQRSPYNWSEQLYTRHGETFREYLRSKVLPALRTKRDTFLLQELVARWENHKIMNKWMWRFFMYLVRTGGLPSPQ